MKQSRTTQHRFGRGIARAASLVLALLFVSSFLTPVFAQYKRTDLVSNQPGVAPTTDEQHLVNAWGLTALPRSPFWVSDNGTGSSTLCTGAGQQIPLFVTIAPAPGSPPGTLGTPAGAVGNISANATDFTITENGKSGRALFIFATLDGTISGWNPGVDGIDPNTGASHTTLVTDRSNVGALYTGLAIATNKAGQTFLYAADDGPNRRIDIFDGTFSLVKSFGDPAIPRGFSPYGIQTINGHIWVTYTALNKAQGGFVDIFDTGMVVDRDPENYFAGPRSPPRGRVFAWRVCLQIMPEKEAETYHINPFDLTKVWATQV